MATSLPVLDTQPNAGHAVRALDAAVLSTVDDSLVDAEDGELVDSYGRVIRDLRVCVTDRCNFRCRYCMDPDIRFKRKVELLTDTEIIRLVRVASKMGVKRVRLTGGEPMVHPTLSALIRDLRRLDLEDIALTTNGSLSTKEDLQELKDAGLDRITVSLDSVREDRFRHITRSNSSVARVLQTVAWAKEVGLKPVKINAVVFRGFNDDELPALAELARTMGVDVRLIEYMPLDSGRRWEMDKVLCADEMINAINARHELVPIGRPRPHAPATGYRFADGSEGKIGVIATVTRPFCNACSRLRVTAEGRVMPCLFSTTEWDMRTLLRQGGDDRAIAKALMAITHRKQAGHRIHDADYQQPIRPMSAIGG
ncbi:MAG: GTP 3',8-cyclase MoaA [Phycisphaerales bacterium]